jgi:uncharacterized protein
MALSVKVFSSVTQIGKDILDEISNDPLFSYDYYSTVEKSSNFGDPVYLTVFDKDALVAFMPCFIEKRSLSGLFPFLPQIVDRTGLKFNFLLVHSPTSCRTRIIFCKSVNKYQVTKLIINGLRRICKEKKIFLCSFPAVFSVDTFLSRNVLSDGYFESFSSTFFTLNIKWKNFDDYLSSLNYSARGNVRREIKRCHEKGIIIEEKVLEGSLCETVSKLYSNLSSKYNAYNPFDSLFFDNLGKSSKQNIRLLVAKKNDVIIGFSLGLFKEKILDMMMVGFDYRVREKNDFVYFNLCYYDPINWAIKNQFQKIYYRGEMESVKKSRGCNPEIICSYSRYSNRFIRTAVNVIRQLLRRTL